MSSLYTRKGDDGNTGLLGEGRVPKYHPIPEAVGTLDEANASLGLARFACQSERSKFLLLNVQRDLYQIMAEISASPDNASRFRSVDGERVNWLEDKVDQVGKLVQMPREFIVPGDSHAGAALALARTIVRRAERLVVFLAHEDIVENKEILRYLNRLSSLCFVLELYENQESGKDQPTLART